MKGDVKNNTNEIDLLRNKKFDQRILDHTMLIDY